MSAAVGGDALRRALQKVRKVTKASKVFLSYVQPGGQPGELRYGELWDRAARLRTLFAARGLEPGARVLIASQDDGAVVALVLACLEGGYSALVVDPEQTDAEASVQREIADPALFAVDSDLVSRWGVAEDAILPIKGQRAKGRLFQRLLGRRQPASTPDRAAFPAVLAEHAPAGEPAEVEPTGEAYVLFTSGSTSRPKGVQISRHALASHAATLVRHMGYDGESRLLDVLPLHHTDGLMHGVLAAYLAGASALRPLRFQLDRTGELLDSVYRLRATHLIAVPTILGFMEHFGADYADAFDTPDFRFVISSAGPMPAQLWQRFEVRFGVRVVNVYGLTETVCGGLFCGPDDATYRRDTAGKPIDCAIRIVDEAGSVVPAGERGELLLKGENLLTGYVGQSEPVVDADGWFATGDFAQEDPFGFVRIVGRKKSLVISGGLNIQPEEVAAVAEGLAGVAEAVAFGVPHDEFGEQVVLCYVLCEGAVVGEDQLLSACREQLSSYKIPRRLTRLHVLPRRPSGKVDLTGVRSLFERVQAAQPSALEADGSVADMVKAAAARVFQVSPDQLGNDAGPGHTLGWDSFAHLSFVVELERVFGLRLETADVISIRSLGDAIRTIDTRLQAR